LRRLESTLRKQNDVRQSEAQEPLWNVSGTVGAAYVASSEGGGTFTTPLTIRAQRDKSSWAFTFSTDGYTRDSTFGSSIAGLSDLNVTSAYALDLGLNGLEASLKVLLPSHSDVSGKTAKQTVGLALSHSFGLVTANMINRGTHTNHSDGLALSPWGSYHGLNIDYNFCDLPKQGKASLCSDRKLSLLIDRAVLRGTEGSALVGIGYSWTVSGPWSVLLTAAKSLRGPTVGQSLGLEIDYSFGN
jgi:hypothetical protein